MFQIQQDIVDYYNGLKPRAGYIYYFLEDNLKAVPWDQLKIGVGFYRSPWIDGTFLFEADSYLLKALKEFLASLYLKKGGFDVWAEWTSYYSRLWAAVGLSRVMGMGSFYLTRQGPIMIIRKVLDELDVPVEMKEVEGEEFKPMREGYLVYRDPGGGAHLRNWKIFYLVLSEILSKAGLLELDEEFIHVMSGGDPEARFVLKSDDEVYGFPSLYRVTRLDLEQMKNGPGLEVAPPLEEWLKSEAQFDAGGFTEEFRTYYKFMMDHYTRDDKLPDVLSIIEHGVSWFLAVLDPAERPSYRDRYYQLVERFASTDDDRKMVLGWLDEVTGARRMG
jgi:hypothetical protein